MGDGKVKPVLRVLTVSLKIAMLGFVSAFYVYWDTSCSGSALKHVILRVFLTILCHL